MGGAHGLGGGIVDAIRGTSEDGRGGGADERATDVGSTGEE